MLSCVTKKVDGCKPYPFVVSIASSSVLFIAVMDKLTANRGLTPSGSVLECAHPYRVHQKPDLSSCMHEGAGPWLVLPHLMDHWGFSSNMACSRLDMETIPFLIGRYIGDDNQNYFVANVNKTEVFVEDSEHDLPLSILLTNLKSQFTGNDSHICSP